MSEIKNEEVVILISTDLSATSTATDAMKNTCPVVDLQQLEKSLLFAGVNGACDRSSVKCSPQGRAAKFKSASPHEPPQIRLCTSMLGTHTARQEDLSQISALTSNWVT
eukprot:g36698.t1